MPPLHLRFSKLAVGLKFVVHGQAFCALPANFDLFSLKELVAP